MLRSIELENDKKRRTFAFFPKPPAFSFFLFIFASANRRQMKNTMMTIGLLWLLAAAAAAQSVPKNAPYKNAALPVEQRIDDLLSRMTIEEKTGQLRCTMAWNYYERQGNAVKLTDSFRHDIGEEHVGMLWATFRADPWTQKSFDNGLTPELAARTANAMQRYAVEQTRLGIPLFLAEEAPHGHMAIGTTVLPTGLGMAATWSRKLLERAGAVIADEVRRQGAHISYGPVLDLSRDPRWSRVEETMGEDPVLTAELGSAMVRGLGGGHIDRPMATLPTLKHFLAYGTTEGGHNGRPTIAGMRELHERYLPTFRKVVDAGARSIMTSYNSIDGIPSTCNDYLLTDVLQRQWQLQGFVVSDLYSINCLRDDHGVAASLGEAAAMALEAGVDVDLGAMAYGTLADEVRAGRVSEAAVDRAVRRVLRMKMEMGLFEHPYVEPRDARRVGSAAHADVALQMARASVTLLENHGGLLPLQRDLSVAVVGPNADNVYNQLGDYTAPQADGRVVTIAEALRRKIGADRVRYAKGCGVRDTLHADIRAAVEAAEASDVVVAVVGGSSARDFKTSYIATGAAQAADCPADYLPDMDCGEGFDRATLSLLGRQDDLLRALKATGKPLVVVYIEGRPLDKRWAAAHADALLTAYYPGQEGGTAVVDVLFGDYNPAGRLPVSVPRTASQLPVCYNTKAPATRDYMDMSSRPLYAFGYGLSYTTFSYANLEIGKQTDGSVSVAFDVTNTGDVDGEEVPQLYLRDVVASTVQPLRQLKAFDRVMIRAGETCRVRFVLTPDDLSIVDRRMQRVVEPGLFRIMIGPSSDSILLEGEVEL